MDAKTMTSAADVAKNIASLLNYSPHLADSNYSAVIDEITAFADAQTKEEREGPTISSYWHQQLMKKARSEALELAAKHFKSQIRTYTGEQVANALLDIKDEKVIRALKDKK